MRNFKTEIIFQFQNSANSIETQQLAKIAGDSTWFDLISMQPKSSTMTLQPLEVLLLKAQ